MSFEDFEPIYLSVRKEDDVFVVAFKLSSLTEEENIELLGHELFTLIDQFDCRKLVLDMEKVDYVTSAVLGKMITLHRRLHRSDGSLVICRVSKQVAEVMRTSRLAEYFDLAEDLDSAIAMLR